MCILVIFHFVSTTLILYTTPTDDLFASTSVFTITGSIYISSDVVKFIDGHFEFLIMIKLITILSFVTTMVTLPQFERPSLVSLRGRPKPLRRKRGA